MRHPYGDSALLGKCPPGGHIRLVVELCDHHFVAWSPRASEGARHMKCQGRHVEPKHNLLRGRAAEEIRVRRSRAGDHGICLNARRISPVCICVVIEEVIAHDLDDGRRDLRAAGAVKVGDRAA